MGETMRIEASTRAHAQSLSEALAGFAPELVRKGKSWQVEINPDEELTPRLLELFDAVGRWLTENDRVSCAVHFRERSFTLLRPSEAHPTESAEFLLERVIQLETALRSRVLIEQAKGVLAGRLGIPVEDAFQLLRQTARGTGRQLRDLAREIVSSPGLPEELEAARRMYRVDGDAYLVELACAACGYGVAVRFAPERCPMCGGSVWEQIRGAARGSLLDDPRETAMPASRAGERRTMLEPRPLEMDRPQGGRAWLPRPETESSSRASGSLSRREPA